MLKKFLLIFSAIFLLYSCFDSKETENTAKEPTNDEKQVKLEQNNELLNKSREIKIDIITNIPDWVKEMNITEPLSLKFLDGRSKEVLDLKGLSLMYGG